MITFETNNNAQMIIDQKEPDGAVIVTRVTADGTTERRDLIEPGEMVMLINLFRYVKDNDIKNDFINPHGAVTDRDSRVL